MLAFIASVLNFGIGYLYIGRPGLAALAVAAPFAAVAVAGWTRLVLTPLALYTFGAILVTVGLAVVIHTVVLARRFRAQPRKPYNRWWVYMACVMVPAILFPRLLENRGPWLGFESFRVRSESMSPTVELGDFVMVDTWRYRSGDPLVGDIVVVKRKGTKVLTFVKRVVGVPGDLLEIRDDIVYRDGQQLREPYLHPPFAAKPSGQDVLRVALGPGQFYVLGDNRDKSADSRVWGPVPRDEIYGRAEYIWLAISDGSIHWERFPMTVLRH
jgi:signal peptidase I